MDRYDLLEGAISILAIIIVLAVFFGAIAFGYSYLIEHHSPRNPIVVQHERFEECISLEYPRDFCLALVED